MRRYCDFARSRADVRVRLQEPVLVPDVQGQALVADRDRLLDGDARVFLERRDVRRLDAVLDLDVAGTQRLGPRARVGHDPVHDRREVHFRLVVVVRRLHDRDVVAGDAVLEHERADADRALRERAARGERLRRQDHPGAIGELCRQRRIRRLQMQDDRRRVRRVDRADRRDLARTHGPLEGEVTLERRLHGSGVERRSVVELDAGADLDRVRELVLRHLGSAVASCGTMFKCESRS